MSRLLPAALLAALLGPGCFQGPPPDPAAPAPTDEPGATRDRPAAAGAYPHLLLGNPSRAADDPKDKDNFLVKKPYFAVSYNSARGIPNWVSWRVTKADGRRGRLSLAFDGGGLPGSFGPVR
jgi:DNA/RNA endonuclease G (NUC1)